MKFETNPEKNNAVEAENKLESHEASSLDKMKESIWSTISRMNFFSQELTSSKNELKNETGPEKKASEELSGLETETITRKNRYVTELTAALTSLAMLTQAEPLPKDLPTRQDSLLLLQNTKDLLAFYESNNYKPVPFPKNVNKDSFVLPYPENYQKSFSELKRIIPEYKNSEWAKLDADFISKASYTGVPLSHRELKNKFNVNNKLISIPEGIYKNEDEMYAFFNPNAPSAIYHEDIKPDYMKTYEEIDKRSLWEKVKDENPFSVTEDGKTGDLAYVPMYDPLKISPWDQLTDKQKIERQKKYGNTGTPFDSSIKKETQATKKVESVTEKRTKSAPSKELERDQPVLEEKQEPMLARPVMGIEYRPIKNIPERIRISRTEYLAKDNNSYDYILDEDLAKRGDPFPYFKIEKK